MEDQNSVNVGKLHSSGVDVLSPQPPEQGFNVIEPRRIEAFMLSLPCDKCGANEQRLASFYLSNKGEQKLVKGFYSDLAVRLCESCIRAALAMVTQREERR